MSVCSNCGHSFGLGGHSDKHCEAGPRVPETWPPSDDDLYWEMDAWNQGLTQYLAGQPCPPETSGQEYEGWKEGEKVYG